MIDSLALALIALVTSIIAGVFSFTGVDSGAVAVAKVWFGIFIAIAVMVFLRVM